MKVARVSSLVLVMLVAVVAMAAPLGATEAETSFVEWDGRFSDDDGSVHQLNIEALANAEITRGCGGERPLFCPDDAVTRGEMAAFLNRALRLPASDEDFFTDDNDSIFQRDIQALAASGITLGCNPPDNTRFCPDDPVSREQMAGFLVRGLDLPPSDEDVFADDDNSVFEEQIQALAAAGVTRGCNPPDNTLFCPRDDVTRGEMATFLTRALDLTTFEEPVGSGDALLIDQVPPDENARPQTDDSCYQVIFFEQDPDEFWAIVPYTNQSWGAYTFSGGFFVLDGYIGDVPEDSRNAEGRIVNRLTGFGWPEGIASYTVTCDE